MMSHEDMMGVIATEAVAGATSGIRYAHPKTIQAFEDVYRKEYEQELKSCDDWIQWCLAQNPQDTHGINFFQGMKAAHAFNNIKMQQLVRILKQEAPNV